MQFCVGFWNWSKIILHLRMCRSLQDNSCPGTRWAFCVLEGGWESKHQNTVNACLSFTCYIEGETNLHCKAWLSDLKYLKQTNKKVYKWVALCLQFCSAQTKHQDLLSQQFPYTKQKKQSQQAFPAAGLQKVEFNFSPFSWEIYNCTIFPYQCQKDLHAFVK